MVIDNIKYIGLIFSPIETDEPNRYFILLNKDTKLVDLIYDIDGKTDNSIKLFGDDDAFELHNEYTERDMDEVQAIDNIYAHMYFDDNKVLYSLSQFDLSLRDIARDMNEHNSDRQDIRSLIHDVLNKTEEASSNYIEFIVLDSENIANNLRRFYIDTDILSDSEIDSIIETLSDDEIYEIESMLH